MAVSTGAPRRAAAATFPPIPRHRKLYGFGSIYGKTIRDSRLAFIIAAGLLGGMALVMGVAVSNTFPTPQARLEVDDALRERPRVDPASVRVRGAGRHLSMRPVERRMRRTSRASRKDSTKASRPATVCGGSAAA